GPQVRLRRCHTLDCPSPRQLLRARIEHMFYHGRAMQLEREPLFEIARRTFDTPEFRGIEFIETEAKSVINKVPGNFLPFNWTINPYRGCTHSCSYCFPRPPHTYMTMNPGPP